jgi:hypothetical protein
MNEHGADSTTTPYRGQLHDGDGEEDVEDDARPRPLVLRLHLEQAEEEVARRLAATVRNLRAHATRTRRDGDDDDSGMQSVNTCARDANKTRR